MSQLIIVKVIVIVWVICVFILCTGLITGCASSSTQPTEHSPVVINAATIRKYVENLPIDRAASGSDSKRRGLVETETGLINLLRGMGYDPIVEPILWSLKEKIAAGISEGKVNTDFLETTPDNQNWNNIYVDIKGKVLPDEIFVLGAHFDAVPGSPGADDNGSGVAALLSIAGALRYEKPARTIRLAFFNLEELGLIGSSYHAGQAARRKENIIGMVSLESIGYYSDEPGSQHSPIPAIEGVFEPPDTGDCIVMAGTQMSAELAELFDVNMRMAEPALKTFIFCQAPGKGWLMPDIRRSDHGSFLDYDIPAFMLTDTANFRNPNYHRATDTVETLDFDRTAMVTRAALFAVIKYANSTQ